jgi:hypothetical protein
VATFQWDLVPDQLGTIDRDQGVVMDDAGDGIGGASRIRCGGYPWLLCGTARLKLLSLLPMLTRAFE